MPEREIPKDESASVAGDTAARGSGKSDSGKGSAATGALARPIAADQVEAYLRRHPEFLAERPELLDVLTPPARPRGDGVVDLQQVMVERLRHKLNDVTQLRDDLVATGRSNLAIQARVHEAILALLRARSFEEFVETITTDLAVILDLDVVTIGVEQAADGAAWKPVAGVYCLKAGTIDALLGRAGSMLLREDVAGDPAIFDAAAGLVRSDALIRLGIGKNAPPALLALGSRQTGAFHAGQGTELLSFLSQVLEETFRAWLHLPSES
ncbi:MAG: DUF484 family protein [Kiloniellaceae bacterium]